MRTAGAVLFFICREGSHKVIQIVQIVIQIVKENLPLIG